MLTVRFVPRTTGPERLVCEAELVFGPEAGPLEGLKLVGFSLWRSAEGETYVSFPSRAFGRGSERRYFDLLRPVCGDTYDMATGGVVKRLKAWVLEEHAKWTLMRIPSGAGTISEAAYASQHSAADTVSGGD